MRILTELIVVEVILRILLLRLTVKLRRLTLLLTELGLSVERRLLERLLPVYLRILPVILLIGCRVLCHNINNRICRHLRRCRLFFAHEIKFGRGFAASLTRKQQSLLLVKYLQFLILLFLLFLFFLNFLSQSANLFQTRDIVYAGEHDDDTDEADVAHGIIAGAHLKTGDT